MKLESRGGVKRKIMGLFSNRMVEIMRESKGSQGGEMYCGGQQEHGSMVAFGTHLANETYKGLK